MVEDLRVVKTNRALYGAMLSLLGEKSFNKITVNDICKRALISRTTFYAHFDDKYDLAVHSLKEKFKQIGVKRNGQVYENLFIVLESVKENGEFYKNLMLRQNDSELFERLLEYIKELIYSFMADCNLSEEEKRVYATFYASGLSISTLQWIEGGFKTPVNVLARIESKIITKGLNSYKKEI